MPMEIAKRFRNWAGWSDCPELEPYVLVALVSRILLLVFDDATAALMQAKEELWQVQYGIGVLDRGLDVA